MHDIPTAIKDFLFAPGFPTDSGTQVMRDFFTQEDATVAKRLKQPIAIIVGKTQLTEGPWAGNNPAQRITASPFISTLDLTGRGEMIR